MQPLADHITQIQTEIQDALSAVRDTDLTALRHRIDAAQHVYVAGMGRSGLKMRSFAMRLMHIGLAVHVVGDVTTPAIQSGDLLIVGSGSGKTASMAVVAQKAHQVGTPIVLLTSRQGAMLAQFAQQTIVLAPKNDTPASTLPLGSLFELSLGLLLEVIVMQLIAARAVDPQRIRERHTNLE